MLLACREIRVLIICTRFAKAGESPYLTDELADALSEGGAAVRVAVLDWTATNLKPKYAVRSNGVEAIFVAPFRFSLFGSRIQTALRWMLSSLKATPAVERAFGHQKIDLVIAFSPLVVSGFLIVWAKLRFRCKDFAYITDFFPYHQAAANQVSRDTTSWIGLALETFLMRRFDTIACMSPAGVAFLRDRYRLRAGTDTPVVPLWGSVELAAHEDRAVARRRFDLPLERPIAVFGGQISEGRGIEDMLAAAALAASDPQDRTLFLFVGAGRLEALVRDCGLANVQLRPPVARDAYLGFIAACDIGLVSTVAGTGVPTFPSKTIDYLRAGLPIVASVETTTDYRAFVTDNGFGVVVDAGNPVALRDAIRDLSASPERRRAMADAGRVALNRHFDVRRTAGRLLAHLRGERGPGALIDA